MKWKTHTCPVCHHVNYWRSGPSEFVRLNNQCDCHTDQAAPLYTIPYGCLLIWDEQEIVKNYFIICSRCGMKGCYGQMTLDNKCLMFTPDGTLRVWQEIAL